MSTNSRDELVLGPEGDRCQWMFVTAAGDVDMETSESTDEKKRKSRMRRNDKRPAKSLEKGKKLEGWTGRWTDRQAGRSLNDWGWEREGRMQAGPRRRDTSQGV